MRNLLTQTVSVTSRREPRHSLMGCGSTKLAVQPQLVKPGSVQPGGAVTPAPPKRRNSYQSPEMHLGMVEEHLGGGINPFAPGVVGTYSNHGMKPGEYGKPGGKINQACA